MDEKKLRKTSTLTAFYYDNGYSTCRFFCAPQLLHGEKKSRSLIIDEGTPYGRRLDIEGT